MWGNHKGYPYPTKPQKTYFLPLNRNETHPLLISERLHPSRVITEGLLWIEMFGQMVGQGDDGQNGGASQGAGEDAGITDVEVFDLGF